MLQLLRRNDYMGVSIFLLTSTIIWVLLKVLLPNSTGVWSTPLAKAIYDVLSATPKAWLAYTLHLLLILGCSLYLNWLVSNYHLLYRDTALPGFFYGLFQLLIFGQNAFSAGILAAPIVLLVFHIILVLFGQSGFPASLLFWMGMILWLGILLYFDVLFLLLAFLPGLFIVRAINWREFALIIFGGVTGFYFSWAISRLLFGPGKIELYSQLFYYSLQFDKLRVSNITLALLALVAVVLLFALTRQYRNFYKNNVRTRTIQQFLFLFLVCSILLCILSAFPLYANFGLIAPPLAYFFAYFFIEKGKGIFKSLLLLAIIALAVMAQIESFQMH